MAKKSKKKEEPVWQQAPWRSAEAKRKIKRRAPVQKFRKKVVTKVAKAATPKYSTTTPSGNSPVDLTNRGVQYYNDGKYESAYYCFKKALEINPFYEEAKRNLNYAWQMMQKHRKW